MATIDKDQLIEDLKKQVSTLKKQVASLKKDLSKEKKQTFFYEKIVKSVKEFVIADSVRNDSINHFHTVAKSFLKQPEYEAKQAQQIE